MATWPNTLPQNFLQDGFTDSEPTLTVKEQMDSGPPITRQICTANVRSIDGVMILTTEEKIILREFYRANCAVVFDFPDPDTGLAVSVMFTEKPTFAGFTGYYHKVSLKLEILP